jgi:hypothetical protein
MDSKKHYFQVMRGSIGMLKEDLRIVGHVVVEQVVRRLVVVEMLCLVPMLPIYLESVNFKNFQHVLR